MMNPLFIYSQILLFSAAIFLYPNLTSATVTFGHAGPAQTDENLHGILKKIQLSPPLRDDIAHIRFSPDGKYVLAQDAAGINVLSHEPFVFLFRIAAPNSYRAQFTPDSQNIVFYNSALLVQVWNVVEKRLISQRSIVSDRPCIETELSPDGKSFACFDDEGSLSLLDVATGAEIFRRKQFKREQNSSYYIFNNVRSFLSSSWATQVNLEFSPDGRYFAAGLRRSDFRQFTQRGGRPDATKQGYPNEYEGDSNSIAGSRDSLVSKQTESPRALAIDIATHKEVSLGGSLKQLISGRFTFVAGNRIVGLHRDGTSEITPFPSGSPASTITLDSAQIEASGKGDFVIMRPAGENPVGVFDLKSDCLLIAIKRAALDIYDNVYVSERMDGDLGLYDVITKEMKAKAHMPGGASGSLRAVEVSPDFKWLAASIGSRAAVWNLNNGERRFFLRAFDGAHYSDDESFFVDFPLEGTVKRTIGILRTQQGDVLEGPLVDDVQAANTEQYGQYLTIMRRLYANTRIAPGREVAVLLNVLSGSKLQVNEIASLQVLDVRTMKQIWQKPFAKTAPRLWVDAPNETMVLGWDVRDDYAKAEIKSDSRLNKQFSTMKEKVFNDLFQILDAKTGKQRGSFLFDTEQGSRYVGYVIASNDSALVVTRDNVFVYSISDGQLRAKLPGHYATLNNNANRLCVVRNREVSVYELGNLNLYDQFKFSNPVTLARFSVDGKRLFVLTQSQTAYLLDVSSTVTSKNP